MSDALSSNNVVRRAFLKLDASVTLAAVDALDLRANAKVSAVIGVPLRQLQQRRDVVAFATSAPVVAQRALLELLAAAPLEKVISMLGEDAESPSYEQLSAAVDGLLGEGGSLDDVVALLAFAIGESFPAAGHCRRLLEERSTLSLPELPALATTSILAAPKVVSDEIRLQRKLRRDEARRRTTMTGSKRLSRPKKSKRSVLDSADDDVASSFVRVAPEVRRPLVLTPLERSKYDERHALVGTVVLVDVPFGDTSSNVSRSGSKIRPALVVAGAESEFLVRPIYSKSSASRSPFHAWRRLGLEHASYIDDLRLGVHFSELEVVRLGQLTVSEWNALV